MTSFYLDNDVSLRLVPLLRARGHVLSSARDEGLTAVGDDVQLLTAVQRVAVLVTYNRRDFELLHDAWRFWPPALGVEFPAHPGILVLAHAPVPSQISAIDELIEGQTFEMIHNRVLLWRPLHGWVPRP